VDLIQQSAELNHIDGRLQAQRFNWNDELPREWKETFELVIGADILYMAMACAPVARTIQKALKIGGLAVIVDPGRSNVEQFESACLELQLDVQTCTIKNLNTPLCTLKRCHIVLVRKDKDSTTVAVKKVLERIQNQIELYQRKSDQLVDEKSLGFCLKE